MKSLKRLLLRLVIIVVVIVVALVLARNILIKLGINSGSKMLSGLNVSVDKVDVGLTKSAAGLEGITIHTAAGFPEGTVIEIPEVYVDYNHRQILGDTIHLEELRLRIDKVVVVKNSEGEINLLKLVKVLNERFKSEQKKAETPGKKSGKAIKIDRLQLDVGSILYKDHSVDPPTEKVINLNIHEVHEDISSPAMVATIITLKAMSALGMDMLSLADMDVLKGMAGGSLDNLKGMTDDAMQQAQGIADEFTKSPTNVLNKATDALKKLF